MGQHQLLADPALPLLLIHLPDAPCATAPPCLPRPPALLRGSSRRRSPARSSQPLPCIPSVLGSGNAAARQPKARRPAAPVDQQLALHVLADRGAALNHFDHHVLLCLLVARQVHLAQRGAEQLAHRLVVPAGGGGGGGRAHVGWAWGGHTRRRRRKRRAAAAAGGPPPRHRRALPTRQAPPIACLWPRKGQEASTLEVAPSPPVSAVVSVVAVFLRSGRSSCECRRAGASADGAITQAARSRAPRAHMEPSPPSRELPLDCPGRLPNTLRSLSIGTGRSGPPSS